MATGYINSYPEYSRTLTPQTQRSRRHRPRSMHLWCLLLSLLALLCMLPVTHLFASPKDSVNYSLIPKPVHLQRLDGVFELDRPVRIESPHGWQPIANLLQQTLPLIKDSSPKSTGAVIEFIKLTQKELLQAFDSAGSSHQNGSVLKNHLDEAYILQVTKDHIRISAAHKTGAIHGLYTLVQLQKLQWDPLRIPSVTIKDYPRFAYRGMMLDVSRNFFPLAYIKKFIDLLALYKFNNFHWHLTDGAGWRLEIKKYPKLTQMSAWRPQGPQTRWSAAGRKYSREGAPGAYGGYYTQREAKEIVRYAMQRGINVIPEIELPGHAEEALAAYPWLSATGKAEGVSEYNVCSDGTFTFLENVLSEVMDIFPSKYIHIGGDEASKRSWKGCEACQVLMQKEQLNSLEQIQSYAIKRIEKFLHKHHRKLLGWDEITQGGLADDAAVMVWRDPHTGIRVARKGHQVIMTPGKYLYFDHYQSDPATEPPAIGGYIPLSKVYHYNPLPLDSLTAQQRPNLLGVQANLFTEFVPTQEHADYMLFPRTLAVAEIGWTPYKEQNYDRFLGRMQNQYLLLQRANVQYCRPRVNILQDHLVDTLHKCLWVTLSSERYHPDLYYTLDGKNRALKAHKYKGPIQIKGHQVVKAAIFSSADTLPLVIDSFQLDYHKAIGKKVIYQSPYAKRYKAAGNNTLTDGITGSLTYSDDRWQGFLGKAFDVTVDMGKTQGLNSLDIRFMQLTGPGVYMPGSVKIMLSNNNKDFKSAGEIPTKVSPKQSRLRFEGYHFDLNGQSARYIRVVAPNTHHGFLFTDEIIIY